MSDNLKEAVPETVVNSSFYARTPEQELKDRKMELWCNVLFQVMNKHEVEAAVAQASYALGAFNAQFDHIAWNEKSDPDSQNLCNLISTITALMQNRSIR